VPVSAQRSASPRRQSGAAGFSLIEMLIALLVVTVGLLGMAGLQAYSLRNNVSAYHRSVADDLAYQILDMMRANRPGALNGSYDTIRGTAASGSRARIDLDNWQSAIAHFLPGGQGIVDCAIPPVCAVTIQWNDNRVASGLMQQLTVSTRL
jgi:type IV pilus assembly protein PilV